MTGLELLSTAFAIVAIVFIVMITGYGMTTKTHSKLKGKTLDPFERGRKRWQAAEYRRLQQRRYDARKKENRPWSD